jgi:hypothetical protein
MIKHINLLTKIIENQVNSMIELNRRFNSIDRILAHALLRIGRLEGMKDE